MKTLSLLFLRLDVCRDKVDVKCISNLIGVLCNVSKVITFCVSFWKGIGSAPYITIFDIFPVFKLYFQIYKNYSLNLFSFMFNKSLSFVYLHMYSYLDSSSVSNVLDHNFHKLLPNGNVRVRNEDRDSHEGFQNNRFADHTLTSRHKLVTDPSADGYLSASDDHLVTGEAPLQRFFFSFLRDSCFYCI